MKYTFRRWLRDQAGADLTYAPMETEKGLVEAKFPVIESVFKPEVVSKAQDAAQLKMVRGGRK